MRNCFTVLAIFIQKVNWCARTQLRCDIQIEHSDIVLVMVATCLSPINSR